MKGNEESMSTQPPDRRLSVIGKPRIPAATPQMFWANTPETDGPSLNRNNQLGHYVWLFRRHRWRVASFVLTCLIATWLITQRITPYYEATATIDIDRQLPVGIVGPESSRMQSNDTDQFIATQLRILQSDSVLRPVAQRFRLREHEGQGPSESEAPVTLKRFRVSRPPNTHLVYLTYRSADPQLAAKVANAVAQSYLEHTYTTRVRASTGLTTFMENQLVELRAKMERSSEALVRFERDLNLANNEEKTNIQAARLLQLNTEYTQAQSDRVRKEAALESVQSGSLESVQVSGQGEALKRLNERLSEARERFAEVNVHFGPAHPEHRKLAAALRELERQMEASRKNIASRVEAEYREALSRERMLDGTVRQTKRELDQVNTRAFQYQSLKREADADKKLYDELVRKIKEASINAGFQSSAIRIADPARPPDRPVSPNLAFNLVGALVIATLLAGCAALVVDALDNTIREPEEGQKVLGQDVVANLPLVRTRKTLLAGNGSESSSLVALRGTDSHEPGGFDESIRGLRNSILLSDLDRQLRSLLITSASPSEGKSTTAAHLAVAHAEHGRRTLLIDADLRRPSIHRRFQTESGFGLSNVLTGEVTWQQAVRSSGQADLSILAAGHPSRRASDLIGRGLYEVLDEASREYDLVIVDAPPLLGFSESLQMAALVDGVLVVVKAGATSRSAVRAVVTALTRLRAHIVGIVLNGVSADMGESYRYYAHYGKYYRAEQVEAGSRNAG